MRQQSINHLAVGSSDCSCGSKSSLDRVGSFHDNAPVRGCDDQLVPLFQVSFGPQRGWKHNPSFGADPD
jgi:hypothetical protein